MMWKVLEIHSVIIIVFVMIEGFHETQNLTPQFFQRCEPHKLIHTKPLYF